MWRAVMAVVVVAGFGWSAGPEAAAAQKRQRDVITREEIQASAHRDMDLFQAVRSLRPHFLAPPRGNRTMGSGRPANTVVYIDGNKAGELDALKNIPAANVEEVRYLDPARAEEEYGITHNGGAVLVKLAQAPKPPA